jgi:hypothetical protein
VNFDEPERVVINLLPESQRGFIRRDFLEIPDQPVLPPCHLQPIAPPSIFEFLPVAEFLFVV